jgi:lipid-A-disaccharide synthase
VTPKTFMLIAGETSGDRLAADLVAALREKAPEASFFGAGGPRMAAAGVELAFDLTRHAVVGLADVLKNYFQFRKLFLQLRALAIARKPDAVIGVDFGGFNLRLGGAIREFARFDSSDWRPKIVQFVSPQVWASRPGRADWLARDYDLLLSIFPFEKDWYARRAPKLRVEFVGHPLVGRWTVGTHNRAPSDAAHRIPTLLLLPGSRRSEWQRHLPVMRDALKAVREQRPDVKAKMVLPDESLRSLAQASGAGVEMQIGHLPEALAAADAALASTGTVTMECAFAGVPAVTLYKAPLLDWGIRTGLITVKWFTMPNLLAGEEIYPEFLGRAATPENLSRALLELLQNEPRRQKIQQQLRKVIVSLGEPGAAQRAAAAILSLFK